MVVHVVRGVVVRGAPNLFGNFLQVAI